MAQSDMIVEAVRYLRSAGYSQKRISDELDISVHTVKDWCDMTARKTAPAVISRQEIDAALGRINRSNRSMAIFAVKGRLATVRSDLSEFSRAISVGKEWIGTYSGQAEPELVAEDLEACGFKVA